MPTLKIKTIKVCKGEGCGKGFVSKSGHLKCPACVKRKQRAISAHVKFVAPDAIDWQSVNLNLTQPSTIISPIQRRGTSPVQIRKKLSPKKVTKMVIEESSDEEDFNLRSPSEVAAEKEITILAEMMKGMTKTSPRKKKIDKPSFVGIANRLPRVR